MSMTAPDKTDGGVRARRDGRAVGAAGEIRISADAVLSDQLLAIELRSQAQD